MKQRAWIVLWLLVACNWCAPAQSRERPRHYRCEATAFSIRGKTQTGVHAQEGVVAADPRIFPLGTVVRISDAGPYSGSYVVTDTGSRIVGRRIDIFIASRLEARRFGRKRVSVHVLRWGAIVGSY